jgi:DNA-binding NarL/FixJ family response regulator
MACIAIPQPTAEDKPVAVAMANKSKAAPRVFLADDQQDVLRTVASTLEQDFQIVGLAQNGKTVLELVPSLCPDVLVLDIVMPVMGGIEIASRLKESAPTTKVVFLTVFDDPDFLEAARSTGALGYVLKPQLATDLVPAIQKVLEGHTFVSRSMHTR